MFVFVNIFVLPSGEKICALFFQGSSSIYLEYFCCFSFPVGNSFIRVVRVDSLRLVTVEKVVIPIVLNFKLIYP